MSTQAIAYASVMLLIGSITLLGCWLQWRWWIIGKINRWKARRYLERERIAGLRVNKLREKGLLD